MGLPPLEEQRWPPAQQVPLGQVSHHKLLEVLPAVAHRRAAEASPAHCAAEARLEAAALREHRANHTSRQALARPLLLEPPPVLPTSLAHREAALSEEVSFEHQRPCPTHVK